MIQLPVHKTMHWRKEKQIEQNQFPRNKAKIDR